MSRALDVIAKLRSLGVPADEILEVVELMSARSSGAERVARHRERKKSEQASNVTCNVTSNALQGDAEVKVSLPSLPPFPPPTPPPISPNPSNPSNLSSEVPSDTIVEDLKPKKKKRNKPKYSPDFEVFWQLFPTTSTMSKLNASEQFERLDADDQRLATAALPAWKAAQKPGYELHAERYLRHRRFDGLATDNVIQIIPTFSTPDQWAEQQRARHAGKAV